MLVWLISVNKKGLRTLISNYIYEIILISSCVVTFSIKFLDKKQSDIYGEVCWSYNHNATEYKLKINLLNIFFNNSLTYYEIYCCCVFCKKCRGIQIYNLLKYISKIHTQYWHSLLSKDIYVVWSNVLSMTNNIRDYDSVNFWPQIQRMHSKFVNRWIMTILMICGQNSLHHRLKHYMYII